MVCHGLLTRCHSRTAGYIWWLSQTSAEAGFHESGRVETKCIFTSGIRWAVNSHKSAKAKKRAKKEVYIKPVQIEKHRHQSNSTGLNLKWHMIPSKLCVWLVLMLVIGSTYCYVLLFSGYIGHAPDNLWVSSGWAKDCCYFIIPIYVPIVYWYDNLCTRVA